MQLAHLVKLALVLWVGRWLAMELAARYALVVEPTPDGPLPGSFE